MTTKRTILLGYEIGTAAPVHVPVHHLVCTGLTGFGKTTTLEALIQRADMRAVIFRTKRGESQFGGARRAPLFYRGRSDWQYVESLLASASKERKLKFERPWIIRLCRGTKTPEEVAENNERELAALTEKGKEDTLKGSVHTTLKAYFDLVLPELHAHQFSQRLDLGPGVNVMDLVGLSEEVQGLVIAATLEELRAHAKDTITVIPEAWKFLPQDRSTPVKMAAEAYIREGRAVGLWLWVDSQDLAGVDKPPLKSIDTWILGRVKERNEVAHFIDQIPAAKADRPKPQDFMRLGLGEFYAVAGNNVTKCYVLPAWMKEADGQRVARGEAVAVPPPTVHEHKRPEEDPAVIEQLRTELADLKRQLTAKDKEIADLRAKAQKDVQAAAAADKSAAEFARALRRKPRGEFVDDPIKEADVAPPNEGAVSLQVEKNLSELEIRVARPVVNASEEEPRGRMALLIADGFFSAKRTMKDIGDECTARGWPVAHIGNNKNTHIEALDQLCRWGFLRKYADGKHAVQYGALDGVEGRIKVEE